MARQALLLAIFVTLVSGDIYYIIPGDNTTCPSETNDDVVLPTDHSPHSSCLTLLQYTQLWSEPDFPATNNTLLFVLGHHTLPDNLHIQNVSNLALRGTLATSPIVVSCTNSSGFNFNNIYEVTISNLVFDNCQENSVRLVDQLRIEDCRFQNGHGIELRNVTNATFEKSTFSNLTAFRKVQHPSSRREMSQVSGGGIISFDSNLLAIECHFEQNSANGHGGAIYTTNGMIRILDSVFYANTAGYDGGAVWSWSGSIYVSGGIFSGNRAAHNGGVIRTGSACVSIEGTLFSSNRAKKHGGVIRTMSGDISIMYSNFSRNSVGQCGGALWTLSSNITLYENNFLRNSARRCGGAIWTQRGSVFVDHCNFSKNKARHDGGAIRTDSGKIGIYSSNFLKNLAEQNNGGAIETDSGSISMHSSNFTGNKAQIVGGVLYSRVGSANISSCKFESNIGYYDAGAIAAGGEITSIRDSNFSHNSAHYFGGALLLSGYDRIDIQSNIFSHNSASDGGAIAIFRSHIYVHDSDFISNIADYGGAIHTEFGEISVFVSNFTSNRARLYGGVMWTSWNGNIDIHRSNFTNNTAIRGGVIHSEREGTLSIYEGNFNFNAADRGGGAIWTFKSINIYASNFSSNTVNDNGGALFLDIEIDSNSDDTNEIRDSIFIDNHATNLGGAIYVHSKYLNIGGYVQITNNSAKTGVVYASQSTFLISGNTTISENKASVYAFNSNITFNGATDFIDNTHKHDTRVEEGGAITAFQSEIYFYGTTTISGNAMDYFGGAIISSESKIYAYGSITIANNTALSGGGIYSYQSELNFEGKTVISENVGIVKGGGIYAVGSSIKVYKGKHEFMENTAEKGGAICFELNAKIYMIKAEHDFRVSKLRVYFTNNFAKYGGALYISDETNSGICAANTEFSGECFFQDLALYLQSNDGLNIQDTFFANNSASKFGGTIFGGLLDRCTISPYAQLFKKYIFNTATTFDAISYITNITDLQVHEVQSEISSQPVRVCFCAHDLPNCNGPPLLAIKVRKGETFKVALVTVDQVRNPVPSFVRAVLSSNSGGLSEGQDIQATTSNCTELNFTITSPHDSELLTLYADGPCSDNGISTSYINVTFLPCNCPIGFIRSTALSTCTCDCDPCLSGNIMGCSIGNSSVQRNGDVWINHNEVALVADSQNVCLYLIHPHCPFDYCYPSKTTVWINLNTLNGSDAQCAFNRAGKLCGSCRDGLSITLGSSHCIQCSNYWLILLIVFAVAGLAVVTFLLVCNLTVAVGTINGLIFYANILTINRPTFFPFQSPNFFTIFIAWLNLDFGFVTCFFDGMDGYIKEWLQLAFPVYIIFLVTMVIIACECSTRIAKVFAHMNPVATLATLILLSYAKTLRVIIAALSFATLTYPDGSQETVWLIDANVTYFSGKHIPLFLVALFIILVGIVYTSLIFSYQWLLRCPNRRALKWIKDTRFYAFMDVYLAPYGLKHRYWTGLLLLIRAFLYIVAAVNVSGDPRNNLLSIIITLVCLLLLKLLLPGRIYKSWPLDGLETSFIVNLIIFSTCSLYVRGAGVGNQEALTYTSLSIVFITFLAILVYHTYSFVLQKKARNKLMSILVFSKKQKNNPEIIHMSQDTVTRSVIEGKPSQQELIQESAASNKCEVEVDIEPSKPSASLASEPTTNTACSQTVEENTEMAEQKIESVLGPSIFADIRLDPYIHDRDSDKFGMERESEMSDCF